MKRECGIILLGMLCLLLLNSCNKRNNNSNDFPKSQENISMVDRVNNFIKGKRFEASTIIFGIGAYFEFIPTDQRTGKMKVYAINRTYKYSFNYLIKENGEIDIIENRRNPEKYTFFYDEQANNLYFYIDNNSFRITCRPVK